MNYSFDDYLDLTNEAIKLLEEKDVFKFEQVIIMRKEIIEYLSDSKNAGSNLNVNKKKEIMEAEKTLKEKAEDFYLEVKNDLIKIKTEKTLNKYDESNILGRVGNKIDSSC